MTTAARLQVDLIANTSAFTKQLQSASKEFTKIGKDITAVGKGFTQNVTAPIVAIGAAAVASVVSLGNWADELLDMSEITGLSTDALQNWRAVAVQAGVSSDLVADSVKKMTTRLATGAEGSADLRMALEELGISLTDASGNTRSMDTIVAEAISGLSEMEDVTKRNVTATKLFGRSGSELAPILGLGAEAIAEAKDRAKDLGLIMGGDALNAANEFRVEWDFMKESLGAVGREMGVEVMPLVREFVGLVNDEMVPKVKKLIERFKELDDETKKVITVVAGLTAAIGPLLVVAGALTVAIGVLISPVTAVIAILALAGVGIYALIKDFQAWRDEVSRFIESARKLWVQVKTYLGNLLDGAVQWALDMVAEFVGLKTRAAEIVDEMMGAVWDNITAGFTKVATAVKTGVDNVTGFFSGMYDTLVGNSIVPDTVDGVLGEFGRMRDDMGYLSAEAVDRVEDEFDRMTNPEAGILATVDGVLGDIKTRWDTVSGILSEPIQEQVDDLLGKVGVWWDWANEVIGVFKAIWAEVQPIIDGMQQGLTPPSTGGVSGGTGSPGGSTAGEGGSIKLPRPPGGSVNLSLNLPTFGIGQGGGAAQTNRLLGDRGGVIFWLNRSHDAANVATTHMLNAMFEQTGVLREVLAVLKSGGSVTFAGPSDVSLATADRAAGNVLVLG